jgi:hypothetical protein
VAADSRPPPRATSAAPALTAEPFRSEGEPGGWIVRWRIRNGGALPVRIASAIQPHGLFRTDETKIGRELGPHATTDLSLPVRFSEPPGGVIENPFLILRVVYEGADWLVLVRVRVTAGPRGEPVAGDEVIVTTDRAGVA